MRHDENIQDSWLLYCVLKNSLLYDRTLFYSVLQARTLFHSLLILHKASLRHAIEFRFSTTYEKAVKGCSNHSDFEFLSFN